MNARAMPCHDTMLHVCPTSSIHSDQTSVDSDHRIGSAMDSQSCRVRNRLRRVSIELLTSLRLLVRWYAQRLSKAEGAAYRSVRSESRLSPTNTMALGMYRDLRVHGEAAVEQLVTFFCVGGGKLDADCQRNPVL